LLINRKNVYYVQNLYKCTWSFFRDFWFKFRSKQNELKSNFINLLAPKYEKIKKNIYDFCFLKDETIKKNPFKFDSTFGFFFKNYKNMCVFSSNKTVKSKESFFISRLNYIYLSLNTHNNLELSIFFWFILKKNKIVCILDDYVIPSFFKIIVSSGITFFFMSSFFNYKNNYLFIYYLFFLSKKKISFCSSVVEH
jgi:hypothetical protein